MTFLSLESWVICNFNTLAQKGEFTYCHYQSSCEIFQYTRPKGRVMNPNGTLVITYEFQYTRPKGRVIVFFVKTHHLFISIHSPKRASSYKCIYLVIFSYFNTLAQKGELFLLFLVLFAPLFHFNTLAQKGEFTPPFCNTRESVFQYTRPKGRVMNSVHQLKYLKISIHSPKRASS